VEQKLALAPKGCHRPDRAVIDLASRLITSEVRIDPQHDSLCFWLFWFFCSLLMAVGAVFRL